MRTRPVVGIAVKNGATVAEILHKFGRVMAGARGTIKMHGAGARTVPVEERGP